MNLDEEIDILLEEIINKKIYFLSKDNMNNKILKPRIPDNFLTKNGMKIIDLN